MSKRYQKLLLAFFATTLLHWQLPDRPVLP